VVAWAVDVSPAAVYQGIHFRAAALLFGVATALVAPALLRRVSSHRVALAAMAVMGFAILCPLDAMRAAVGSVVVALMTCVVIAHVVHGPEHSLLNRILRQRAFVWTGRRSYGLYLWHWPIFLFMGVEEHVVRFPVAVVLSVAAAAASARWVEFPFLRLKKRFGTTDAPIAAPL
jgi:peptidoglycan/LPS O-acetylase OafA/YrhL